MPTVKARKPEEKKVARQLTIRMLPEMEERVDRIHELREKIAELDPAADMAAYSGTTSATVRMMLNVGGVALENSLKTKLDELLDAQEKAARSGAYR